MTKTDRQKITEELMEAFHVNPEEPGYDEFRACLRKQKYSQEDAAKHAEQIKIFYYKCNYCEYWHLTHHEPKLLHEQEMLRQSNAAIKP